MSLKTPETGFVHPFYIFPLSVATGRMIMVKPLEGEVLDHSFALRQQSNILNESSRYKEIDSRIRDIQARLNGVANQKTKALLQELDEAIVDAESESMYAFYRLGVADCAAHFAAQVPAPKAADILEHQTVERIQNANLHYDLMLRISGLMCNVVTDEKMTRAETAKGLQEILKYLSDMLPVLPKREEVAAATGGTFKIGLAVGVERSQEDGEWTQH